MAVDASVIGQRTSAHRIRVERAPVAVFAAAVGDDRPEYRDARAAGAAGLAGIPAPPTFTFAAPYWASCYADEQPEAPAENPMHRIMGEQFAKGALVLHGEQSFEYHRPVVVGDVLDGEGVIADVYEKETEAATMTFVVTETTWRDAESGAPVVTERFNLIARLRK